MTFENLDNEPEEMEEAPPEESGNRLFIILAAVLGGLTVLALICIAIFLLVLGPQNRARQEAQQATAEAQQILIEEALTATAAEEFRQATLMAATNTPTITPIPPTATASPSPVIVIPTTAMVSPTVDPRTQTVEALLTEAAQPTTPGVPATTTSLPSAGFADEVGLPMLLGLAVILILVFFVARRLRMAG